MKSTPFVLCRVLFKRHARFRKQCNTFFIDLVSNMCFKDNSPPSSAVIHDLLSFLLVETNTVPNHKGMSHLCVHSCMCLFFHYYILHVSSLQVTHMCGPRCSLLLMNAWIKILWSDQLC